jgi:hypothetical protein
VIVDFARHPSLRQSIGAGVVGQVRRSQTALSQGESALIHFDLESC